MVLFTNNLAVANLKEYLFSGFRQNFPVGEFRSMEVSRFDEEGWKIQTAQCDSALEGTIRLQTKQMFLDEMLKIGWRWQHFS